MLVGKRGFIDRSSNVQIVDWRNAPVSRIYYRYEEGDDYEEEIAGRRVEGVVEARRNVSIARGNLRRIGTPQGTYLKDARGAWVQAVGQIDAGAPRRHGQGGAPGRARPAQKGMLGVHHGVARADKALPEIAALIDKEQFELITQPGSGIVVIQGGAGSGKTTVALHRVAYLNFQDGRRFKPQNMLFVVPSQALVRYVGGVLPALGVGGVPVVTYTGWARTTRMRCLPGRADQVQRRAAGSGVAREEAPGAARRCSSDAVAHAGRSDRRASSREISRGRARASGTGWSARAGAAAVGLASWLKKQPSSSRNVRVALEGFVKRCEEARRRLRARLGRAVHRSGRARRRASPAPTSPRGHRAPRRVGASASSRSRRRAPVDEEGNPMLDAEG